MATNNLLKHHYVIYCSILCISQLKGRTLRNAASLANFSVKSLTEMAPTHLQYQCPCPCKREHETCITSPPLFRFCSPPLCPPLLEFHLTRFCEFSVVILAAVIVHILTLLLLQQLGLATHHQLEARGSPLYLPSKCCL